MSEKPANIGTLRSKEMHGEKYSFPHFLRNNVLTAALTAAGVLVPTVVAFTTASSCVLDRQGQLTVGQDAGTDGSQGGTAGETPDGGSAGNGGEAGNAGGHAGMGGIGGSGIEGGAGGIAGQGGMAGTGGIEGGAGGVAGQGGMAGTGGEAGAGGCMGVELHLNDMAEYEYQVREAGCAGPIVETSLGNAVFESGLTTLCLQQGTAYKLTGQVKDAADNHSFEVYLPDDSAITSADFTTLVTADPMDDALATSICTAGSGTIACTDADAGNTGHYKCVGMASVSNGFDLTIQL